MSDIVTNLLHLSSEVTDADEFLESALDSIVTSAGAESAAVLRATPPTWSVAATRGVGVSAAPTDLAAEALERGALVRRDRWSAAPLMSRRPNARDSSAVQHALLLRGNVAD